MADPLVTAIISTKDRAKLCVRAVESVLAQTYPALECIVIDDGSADGTQRILAERFGDRIRVVRHETAHGVARSRNEAIELARGDYVAFLDSDDEWLPRKTEKQVELAERGAGVVYCRAANFSPEGEFLGLQRDGVRGDVARRLIAGNPIASSAVLLRRSCLEHIEPFRSGIYSEDWDLWLRLSLHYRFDFVPEVLVRIEYETGSRHRSMPVEALIASYTDIYATAARDPAGARLLRHHRRIWRAAFDYYVGAQALAHGRRAEAAKWLLRSIVQRPIEFRAWKSLAVLIAGRRLTAAGKALRKRLYAQRVDDSVLRANGNHHSSSA